MNKSRAVLSHLWPSLLVLAIISGLILFAWYPYPFLQFEDSGKFSLALIIIACFIGPALTWLVYKKGKRSLVPDLVIVVLIQVAALTWGVYTIYQNRPYFMVFTVNQFEVLSIHEVNSYEIRNPEFMDKPLSGPILLYANMPVAGPGFQRLLREIMIEGRPDIQFRPEYWSLYSQRQQLVLKSSRPLLELRDARPESVIKIDKLVKNNGGNIADLSYVPALLPNGHFAAILDAHSGEVIDNLVIDPWLD